MQLLGCAEPARSAVTVLKNTQSQTPAQKAGVCLSWNLYAGALLFLYTFFQGMQWPLLPRFLDIYYHLGVMKGFADAGGYVTTAFWEYAPAGRAHLYPPLLHVLMLALYKAGLPAIEVGRFVDCVSYPLLLFFVHRTALSFYTPRIAFFALLLFSSIETIALASVTLSAFNLAFVLGLWMFLCIRKKKFAAAALVLALCFYTHTLAAALMALSLVFYAFLDRESIRAHLLAIVGALALASPFLVYQVLSREFFTFVKVHEMRHFEPDLTVYALALGALAILLKSGQWKKFSFPLALVLGFSPLILTHQPRFFSGHGVLGAVLLAALCAETFLERFKHRQRLYAAGLTAFVLWVLFAGPFLDWNLKTREGRIVWGDRTLTRYLTPVENVRFRSNGFTVYFPEPFRQIVEAIRLYSRPQDILWGDFSYTAGILGVLSDRATSCGMLAEVRPFEKRDALGDARILVWFKNSLAQPDPAMQASIEKRGLRILKETEMAFVLENPAAKAARLLPKPLLSTPWLFGLLALFLVGIGGSLQKATPKA